MRCDTSSRNDNWAWIHWKHESGTCRRHSSVHCHQYCYQASCDYQGIHGGLQLYGLAKIVLSNPEVCKTLFVKAAGAQDQVDANYLFSLVQPTYSAPGSSWRQVEESITDHVQDFLISLEDEQNITLPVTWNYEALKESDQHPTQPMEKFETPELKPSGIMGWLTGQKHWPLNYEELVITASFDHDCFANNPNHKICFPNVRACSREITFPSAHMSTYDEFCHVFMIAYCIW